MVTQITLLQNVTESLAAAGGAAAVIASVQADGWQAVYPSTPPTFDPDNSPVVQAFSRAGFDATGAAVTVSENITMLRRVRNVYPSQATDTALNVALSDYIYSTDTASGVTNNSTVISPKPFGNWTMRGRELVGNSVNWEIIAFHYNCRSRGQVACVRVRGNDGTTQTAWQVVATTAISTYAEDANPIEVYAATLDVTSLATGLFWLEAEVFPWIGGAASVLKSEDSSVTREFSRRYFLKNVSRAASPPLAYVSSTGTDTSHAGWSTVAATAAASPYLTVSGAMADMAVAANSGATGSIMDGCRIRIVDTVSLGGGPATSRAQNIAALVIERAPGTARASAIATHGAIFRPRLGVGTLTAPLTEGAIEFYDAVVDRTGAFTIGGEAATQLQVHLHNITLSNTSATAILSLSHLLIFGVVNTGTAILLGYSSGVEKRVMRGLTADVNNASPEGWVTIGCNITRPAGVSYLDPAKGFIGYNNKWLNPSSTAGVGAFIGTVSGGDLGPLVWVQNLVEALHTTSSTAGWRIAQDGALGNLVHAVVGYNTETGFGSVSRSNYVYDEATVARSHKLVKFFGDIPSQLNTKGDIFQSDGTRTGNFPFTHGVGCDGNFTMFRTNSAIVGNENQTFPGMRCNIGTSTTVRNDPLFTNYQGSNNSGGAPGAGGGTYTLLGGSAARGIVKDARLRFDMAGAARAASNDAAGAYA